MRKIITVIAAALVAFSAPLLTACATGTQDTAGVKFENGWAKSAGADDMSAVFGTIVNSTGEEITVTAAESNVAGMTELHEVTADGVMQELAAGIVIPAGGSADLAPGANHIMLMQLNQALAAGEDVVFTLHFASADGTAFSHEFSVLVKDYAGANEDYDPDHAEHADHSEHDADMNHAEHE